MTRLLASATFLLAATLPLAAQSGPPDAIYYHGHILTGVGLGQGKLDFVSAIAMRDGLVTATGTDQALLKTKGPKTRLVDLGGSFAMPGINDAHTHLGDAGRIQLSVDLTGSKTLQEMLDRIQRAAKTAPAGRWLPGGGWDHTLWPEKTLPTRQELDAVTNGHPAFFERVDGHIAIVNTAALDAAGITRTTPDPKGGKFDHDSAGELTGIVREDPAMEMVIQKIPPPAPAERKRALSLALADASIHGVTSVQDFSEWDDFLVMEQLEHEDHLPVRVSEWLTFADPVETLKEHRAHHPADDPMLHTGMLKGFMDGSLGSRTAALNAPYADDPGNSGIPRYDQAKLDAMTKERAAEHFQMGFHAIGDRAVEMALNAFATPKQDPSCVVPTASIPQAKITCDHRPRIEHSQVLDAPDFDRYKQLGVIASMQPNHLLTDMAWAEQRLGHDRARYSYAWKSFLDHGVPLAFGTDYPVEPITPFRGIYAAVTRENEAGTQSYFPEEKLTIAQALYAYTQGSAYAEFSESYKGTLAPGMVADFIVLDRDLTTIPAHDILGTKVVRTIVAGHPTYFANVVTR
ncbi:MAG TPA: amidohydrolase [Acidobacteriaceae bacterium]|nr:amidohydrolase [Acidobacteriaceae bacterium]